MDHSKALHQLTEAADLVSMLESLTSPSAMSSTQTPASWGGLRITLRNIRETIMSSHDALASEVVSKARAQVSIQNQNTEILEVSDSGAVRQASPVRNVSQAPIASAANAARIDRKDLRAQLERFIEK